MEVSRWIAAGDAQEIAAARLVQLQGSSQCLPEKYGVGEGPWAPAGDTSEIAPTKCVYLQQCDQRLW